ncbi:hypothetical protein IMY05_010G0089800 [Salix suchowensis]|nr:hypothetical protein IMY05_010G0089800 [Salix suchowensis]
MLIVVRLVAATIEVVYDLLYGVAYAHYLLAAQLFRILATASAFGLNCIVTSKPVMELIGDGVYGSKKQAQKLLDHGASFADGLNFMCGQNTASLRSQIFAYHDFRATAGDTLLAFSKF